MMMRARWAAALERIRLIWSGARAWLGDMERAATAALKRDGAVVGTVLLGLGGWALLTDVLVRLIGVAVWELSAGVLCLSLFGWNFAGTIARDGLYALSKRGKKP
jgi:hypothetical protein